MMDSADAATARYKELEAQIQRLEISQRKREQKRGKKRIKGKIASPSASNRKTLPAIRPSTVPGRMNGPGRRSPTAECNERRDIEDKLEARTQELLEEKMALNKRFSGAMSKEYKLQKAIRDKKSNLAVLIDQDNINSRRKEMLGKCKHEQDVLHKTNMAIAVQSNYTRTLNLMKDRLWLNQTTFQKTMDAYYKTMDAAKAEVADVTKMKENAALQLTKAHDRNKRFRTKAAEYMENLQKQLDGLRYMDNQRRELEAKLKSREQARLLGRQRKVDQSRTQDITSKLREASERKKKAQLLEKMDDHEDNFRKIQMASGLETDVEIIDAFNNREAYLSDVVRKVDMLRRQLNEAQKRHNQMKAAFVSELVENDAPGSSSNLVVNLWGGKKGSNVELSTEQLQQSRVHLQRSLREQAKMRGLLIKFAQAADGLYGSLAPMKDTNLDFEAFIAEEEAAANTPRSKGRRSRPSSRPNSSKRRTSGGRKVPNAGSYNIQSTSDSDGESILTASFLSQRLSGIDNTSTKLAQQIMSLHNVFKDRWVKEQAQPEVDGDAETKEDAKAEDGEEATPKPSGALSSDYEDKITNFMWAQKFAVHNNVRVKATPTNTDTPDDRQSFFMQESKAARDREQMDDLLQDSHGDALIDDSEILFDRDAMKKSSLTLVSKNTRRQRRRKKIDGDSASPKGASPRGGNSSPQRGSPRRGTAMRSTAPADN